jgi:hypothetical protein
MENKEDYIDFSSPEKYRQQIEIWYRAYNISREKTELFHDFLISMYDLVDRTFLGGDVLKYEEDQKTHFNWCWDKTIESLAKERIYFKDRGNYHEYFWNFFLEAYYFPKMDDSPVRIKDYFTKLFDFNYIKTRSELDMVMEIYKLLEQNLKK